MRNLFELRRSHQWLQSCLAARVAASCCAAHLLQIIATAATLGEIIADGFCMLVASHVQWFSLTGHIWSFCVMDGRTTSSLHRLAAGHQQHVIQLGCCVLLRQWAGCSELMGVHSRVEEWSTLEYGRLLHQLPNWKAVA